MEFTRDLKIILYKLKLLIFPYEVRRIKRCYVYGIRKVNGKNYLYIGSTCRSLKERFNEHIDDKKHSNPNVYAASKKHKLEIVKITEVPESLRFVEEYKIIKKYKKLYNNHGDKR